MKSRTDYAQNPDKTEQGQLVSSYKCSPLTVDEEFMLSKRQYELVTGRSQKNDVIAYQIRQSFKPGEITAEEANKVGYELAMRFTKGKYAFLVATHTDRERQKRVLYPPKESNRDQLCGVIDSILADKPGSYDGDFGKTRPSDEHGKSNEDQSRTHNFSAADGVSENR